MSKACRVCVGVEGLLCGCQRLVVWVSKACSVGVEGL